VEKASLDREGVEIIAREFTVCPYQLQIDLLPWVDLCVGDIHYVYSYSATLSGLYEGLRWSVLLDEAHNLPDRARSMYSAALSKADLMKARHLAVGGPRRTLDRINRCLLELQKLAWDEPEFHSSREVPESLQQSLLLFVSAIAEQQADHPLFLQQRPELLEFYFQVLQFQRVLEAFGEDYRFEMERGDGQQSLVLRLHCLDGTRQLRERQVLPHAVTAFSATLSPPHWVLRELGFGEEAVYRELPSPFDPSSFRVCLNTRLDTRYRMREASLPGLCAEILKWLDETPGNCIVYFPAYQYMNDALAQLQGQLATRRVLVQERQQSEQARQKLLEGLQSEKNVVAFCILGGVYGEGIDLPGEALNSVIIVGVGLPQFDRRRQDLRSYFQDKTGQGYEFAYLFPGMQRVSQALGRVIRRDSDRGSALLIDQRYADPAYRGLLPACWDYQASDPASSR
jgi:DNA excision repair protein ERCC-2